MKKRRLILGFALFSWFRVMPALAVETTIYVNKHFEVRDRDQPTKYVFNGSTRVAHITGSLSTNARIQRFRLHPGWNLLSLAVSATNLFDQLQRPGVVTSAHAWNAQTGNYSPVPQAASAGMVLWVNATTNATLSIVGTYADPVNREVSAGATYLSGTGLEAWSRNFASNITAWTYAPPAFKPQTLAFSSWTARLTGDLSSVNDLPHTFPPGQALYLINSAPFELEAPDPALRVRYYHQDHLGSSSVMTDANGALVEETAFYPFGIPRHEHRLRQIEEPYKFTQKERDQESGLHYFEARYLTGARSRFASADFKYANLNTLSTEDFDAFLRNPQKMNLYAYVLNNPLRYVDLDGEDIATPLAGRKFDAGKDGRVTVTLKNNIKVTILPDKVVSRTPTGRQAETQLDVKLIPDYKQRTATVTWTIQTYFKQGVNPSGQQSYGRGTTADDIAKGNTTIRFHEGEHGRAFLDYLEKNPPPQFNPEQKPFKDDKAFVKAGQAFQKELNKYFVEAYKANLNETDCVGVKNTTCK